MALLQLAIWYFHLKGSQMAHGITRTNVISLIKLHDSIPRFTWLHMCCGL
jgi:hypothetical protein